MYPTISDLLRDLFGVNIPLPIQSFGFFVALAFVLANVFFALELKRKEKEGKMHPTTSKVLKGAKATPSELIFSGIIGFIIGFKVLEMFLHYSDFVNNPQAFILSARGNFIGGLLFAAGSVYMKYKEKAKQQLEKPVWVDETLHPYEHVGNMTLIAAITGLLGAKIFHNLENLDEFFADPLGAILSFSGLTMYGGLIVGSLSVVYYAKKHKLNIPHLIDTSAPALMLGYGIGRIGCQISGDGDWGIVNNNPMPGWLSFLPDWVWSYNYPHNVIGEGIPIPGCTGSHCNMLPEGVYPTPLYEAAASILLFLVLWGLRKRITVPGVLFSVYLILNGFERFWIEKIRVNTEYNILGGITQAEIISVILILLGITGIIYFQKRHRESLKAESVSTPSL